jgi:hypothetical protein
MALTTCSQGEGEGVDDDDDDEGEGVADDDDDDNDGVVVDDDNVYDLFFEGLDSDFLGKVGIALVQQVDKLAHGGDRGVGHLYMV